MPQAFIQLSQQVFNSEFYIQHFLVLGISSSGFLKKLRLDMRGFVKIELLILVVILGVAALTVGLAFLNAGREARDEQRLADVSQISQALKIYFQENGFYPRGDGENRPEGLANFLEFWPQAPKPDGSCTLDSNKYTYSQKSLGENYNLNFCLGGSGKLTINSKSTQ